MNSINYNLTGKERKELVTRISEIMGLEAEYQKAPTFAYQIGEFNVDKNGRVTGGSEGALQTLKRMFAENGFTAVDDEPAEPEQEIKQETQEAEEPEEEPYLAIQLPMMTGEELSRLESLIEAKEDLIKKALGTDSLMVGELNGKLDFPWFKPDATPDEIQAYMQFVTALADRAKAARRITAKQREVANEKYAFRCFLLQLGFIGDEFKNARKILLKNFTGSSAFRDGRKEVADEISE